MFSRGTCKAKLASDFMHKALKVSGFTFRPAKEPFSFIIQTLASPDEIHPRLDEGVTPFAFGGEGIRVLWCQPVGAS